MTYWLRLDDGFPEHPKVLGLTDAAFRLHVTAMCYARRNMTDGRVPAEFPPRRLARAVPSLIAARLWEPDPDGGGWWIHDYAEWQNTRADVEALSEARSKAGRKGAAIRWQNRGK